MQGSHLKKSKLKWTNVKKLYFSMNVHLTKRILQENQILTVDLPKKKEKEENNGKVLYFDIKN